MAGIPGYSNSLQKQLDAANAQNQSYQQQLQALQAVANKTNVYTPTYMQQQQASQPQAYTPNPNMNWHGGDSLSSIANSGIGQLGAGSSWTPSAGIMGLLGGQSASAPGASSGGQ